MLKDIIIKKELDVSNYDTIKQILNNTDTYEDRIEKNYPEFFNIPIIGLNKKYGIARDIIIITIGLLIFLCYLFVPNEYTYWNILLIISSMIILFTVSRFITFVILNSILYILKKINNITLFYYMTLLNGNMTILFWSIFMIIITVNYLPYFAIEIINIYIKNVYNIFVCTSIISITNFFRLIIIDFIIDVPSYKQFKIELNDFLSFYYKLHNLFGLLTEYKNNKELPKKFTLPYVCKNNKPIIVNIKKRKEAKAIGKILFSYFEEYNKNNFSIDIECFTSLFDKNEINKKNSEELFSLLDKNSSGSISEDEFVDTCELLYNNYNNLSHGLVVNRKAKRALELIIFILYIFIIIFITLSILDIDIKNLYTSLTALTAVWAFALSTSITRFIESILFITVYRVYDIGDVVKINDNILIVKDIKLYNTFFTGNKGDEVSISNSILTTLMITNLYRSKHSLIEYHLEINNNFLKLNLLKNEIELYLKKPNKWSSDFEINIKSTATINSELFNIKLCIKLKHQLSWRYNNQINISKNDFLLELDNIMIKLNIDYKIL